MPEFSSVMISHAPSRMRATPFSVPSQTAPALSTANDQTIGCGLRQRCDAWNEEHEESGEHDVSARDEAIQDETDHTGVLERG